MLQRDNEISLQHFFNTVMIKLGFHGWSLRLRENSTEGYCWKGNRVIDVGLDNSNPEQLLLHEIAHCNTCRFCNQKHTFNFWKVFEDLMRRFLPGVEISEPMRRHQKWASEGIYSLVYESK